MDFAIEDYKLVLLLSGHIVYIIKTFNWEILNVPEWLFKGEYVLYVLLRISGGRGKMKAGRDTATQMSCLNCIVDK